MARKNELPQIVKCMYAGDVTDEYCAQCNGITMIVDGKEFSCTECQGYTEPSPDPDEFPPTPAVEEEPEVAENCQKEPAVEYKHKDASVNTTQRHENTRDETEQPLTGKYTPKGITVSIKAESGLSVETKNGWYRFSYTEERIVPEGVNLELERDCLWDDVNKEVDKQVLDAMESMKK